MKVLMVTYRFHPDPSVAARRVSYWAKNWHAFRGQDTVDVLSTTVQKVELSYLNKYHHVPLGQLRSWRLIKDEGVQWKRDIIEYFDQHGDLDYDLVLMTGGPFMQFSLTPFFKKKWNCKVVLDFRDPFADNPRFGNSWLKKTIKAFHETRFLESADGATVVNEPCVDLVAGVKRMPYAVIPNGFDERSFNSDNRSRGVKIVHAGSFFVDRSPIPLLKVLAQQTYFELDHFGKKLDLDDNLGSKINQYGQIPHDEMIDRFCTYKFGLVVTSKPFESTTKVYEYIGSGCGVLILSYNEPWTGTLATELKPFERSVIWERMDEEGINKALLRLKGFTPDPSSELIQRYSRAHGLKKLVNWIESNIL